MPHASTDTASKPRRQRRTPPPAPPHQHAPSDAPSAGPSVKPPRVHGSYEPAPLHGAAHPQLDQILALGGGPLRLPTGKLNLPAERPPAFNVPPPLVVEQGQRNATPMYQSLFGRGGATVVPPNVQAMLEAGTGRKHTTQDAQYLLAAVDLADLSRRATELGAVDGTPLGNIVRNIQNAVGAPTNRVSGFPETGRTALSPLVRRILLGRIQHVEQTTHFRAKLPTNPTDEQIVRASFGEPASDGGSYWDVLRNLPKDLVETPLYAFQGGYALGHATNRLAHGDVAPIRELGAEQLAAFEHPGAFVQEHPFQALLALGAGASRLGAATARLRGAAVEPRLVPTRHGSQIDRGVSPPNDYVRALHGVQDYLTRPHDTMVGRVLDPIANRLQDQGLRKNVRQASRIVGSQQALEERALADAVDTAKKRLTRRQQERVLGNEAMGATPQQMAHMRGNTPGGEKPLSKAERAYLDATTAYRHYSENVMQDMGLLGKGAALHRTVDPVAQVRAAHGDPLAQQYLARDAEIQQLSEDVKRVREKRLHLGEQAFHQQTQALEGQLSQAFLERNRLLEAIQTRHVAEGGTAPIRVPLKPEDQRVGLFQRSTTGPGGVKRRGKRVYTGNLFQRGNFEAPTHEAFMRDVAAPLNAQRYHRLANHVLDPANHIATEATPGAEIPDDMVLVSPAEPVPPNADLQVVKPGESIFKRLDFHAATVPNRDGYLLVPRVVAQEIYDRGQNLGKGKPGARISQGLRNVLLYSRPSYPLTNLVGNIQQGMFENVGPLSYGRALDPSRHRIPTPPGVEEGGAVRSNFSDVGMPLADKLSNVTPARAVVTTLGHPFRVYTHLMYRAARGVEDATRRAVYLKRAVPAARDIAHADKPAVQRFLMSFREVDAKTQHLLEQMAKGEGDAQTQLAAQNAVEATNRVLGDFAAIPSNAVIDIALPFHRWAQFATRLLVVTLPVHYPGKALLLYRLGSIGEQAQSQLGPLTPSLQGLIPYGNNPQDVLALNTAYPNTFATLGDALAVDPRGGSEIAGLNPVRAASYVSPIARLALTAVTGIDPTTGRILTNPQGEGIVSSDRDHPADPNATEDFLRLLGGQALSLVPPLRLAFQSPNAADTNIPLPGLQQNQAQPQLAPWARNLPQFQRPQTNLQLSPLEQLYNFISPFRARRINLEQLAQQGVQQVSDRLAATQRKESR